MSRLPIDADAIRTLAEILTQTGLTEIEIAEKDTRIRVARAPSPVHTPIQVATMPAPALSPLAPQPAEEVDLARHPGAVTSPMVGVAYLSPEPTAAPFVTMGQSVTAGQTVLLIEAMKTFNQIKAPVSGTVSRILLPSGTPVEYGQVMMLIEP